MRHSSMISMSSSLTFLQFPRLQPQTFLPHLMFHLQALQHQSWNQQPLHFYSAFHVRIIQVWFATSTSMGFLGEYQM